MTPQRNLMNKKSIFTTYIFSFFLRMQGEGLELQLLLIKIYFLDSFGCLRFNNQKQLQLSY